MKLYSLTIKNFRCFDGEFVFYFIDSLKRPLDYMTITGMQASGKTTLLEIIYNLLNGKVDYFNGVLYDKEFNIQNPYICLEVVSNNNIHQIIYYKGAITGNTGIKGITKYYDIYRKIVLDNSHIDLVDTDKVDNLVYKICNYKSSLPMSYGQKCVYSLIVDIIVNRIHDSIILIDELELHLHSLTQRCLFNILLYTFACQKEYNNQIVFTTTSDYLLDIIPNDNIISL